MMHRIKKAIDENKDKWIGIGGKFEAGESPEDCAVREISEETGLCFGPHELRFHGIVTFVSDEWGTEYMHLFTVHADDSRLSAFHPEFNEEGVLDWIPVKEVEKLPIWEGDKIFLRLLADDVSLFYCRFFFFLPSRIPAAAPEKVISPVQSNRRLLSPVIGLANVGANVTETT